jgi:hypothetical protein
MLRAEQRQALPSLALCQQQQRWLRKLFRTPRKRQHRSLLHPPNPLLPPKPRILPIGLPNPLSRRFSRLCKVVPYHQCPKRRFRMRYLCSISVVERGARPCAKRKMRDSLAIKTTQRLLPKVLPKANLKQVAVWPLVASLRTERLEAKVRDSTNDAHSSQSNEATTTACSVRFWAAQDSARVLQAFQGAL